VDFGGDYIDAAMVGYSGVVALMLLLRIISWDDIVSTESGVERFSGWSSSYHPRQAPDSTTPVLQLGLAKPRLAGSFGRGLFANDGDGADCGVLSTALLFSPAPRRIPPPAPMMIAPLRWRCRNRCRCSA